VSHGDWKNKCHFVDYSKPEPAATLPPQLPKIKSQPSSTGNIEAEELNQELNQKLNVGPNEVLAPYDLEEAPQNQQQATENEGAQIQQPQASVPLPQPISPRMETNTEDD
jgi:hypothetical protein